MPAAGELEARVDAVLTVIHLLYATGHTAHSGTDLVRDELTGRALGLARMLRLLLPDDREAAGLLALLLVHHAHRATRTDEHGWLLRLEEQDRAAWDRELIAEADRLVVAAIRAGPPGRFTLQAAIAALHAQAPSYAETDWPQILTLYDELLRIWASPVVAPGRARQVGVLTRVRPPRPGCTGRHRPSTWFTSTTACGSSTTTTHTRPARRRPSSRCRRATAFITPRATSGR